MCDALPNSIDPRRLAELGRALSGSLSLGRMPRLAEVVVASDRFASEAGPGFGPELEPGSGMALGTAAGSDAEPGEAGPASGYAAYELAFRRDASGRALVQGQVSATLRLRCQRCNGILELPVLSRFTLALVQGLDEAARLPDEYEPLLPEELDIDPAALVEDELLLAVPAVPRHAAGTCEPPASRASGLAPPEVRPVAASPTHDNPFAVLESLKRHH